MAWQRRRPGLHAAPHSGCLRHQAVLMALTFLVVGPGLYPRPGLPCATGGPRRLSSNQPTASRIKAVWPGLYPRSGLPCACGGSCRLSSKQPTASRIKAVVSTTPLVRFVYFSCRSLFRLPTATARLVVVIVYVPPCLCYDECGVRVPVM